MLFLFSFLDYLQKQILLFKTTLFSLSITINTQYNLHCIVSYKYESLIPSKHIKNKLNLGLRY